MIDEELREKIDQYCKSQKACELCVFYEAIGKGFLCGSSSICGLKDPMKQLLIIEQYLNRFKKEILGEEK